MVVPEDIRAVFVGKHGAPHLHRSHLRDAAGRDCARSVPASLRTRSGAMTGEGEATLTYALRFRVASVRSGRHPGRHNDGSGPFRGNVPFWQQPDARLVDLRHSALEPFGQIMVRRLEQRASVGVFVIGDLSLSMRPSPGEDKLAMLARLVSATGASGGSVRRRLRLHRDRQLGAGGLPSSRHAPPGRGKRDRWPSGTASAARPQHCGAESGRRASRHAPAPGAAGVRTFMLRWTRSKPGWKR